jgi:hypothetical protein
VDPVDDVVVAGQQTAQDGHHPDLGLAGQLHLHRGAPLPPAVVLGDDDAVGEVQGADGVAC